MANLDKKVWLECECGVLFHSVLVTLYKEDADDLPELLIQVMIRPVSFVERVKRAIRYVFKGGDLHLTETFLDDESITKLSSVIITYRLIKKLREAKLKKLAAKG